MRFQTFLIRPVCTAAVLSFAACTSPQPPHPAHPPSGMNGGPPAEHYGQSSGQNGMRPKGPPPRANSSSSEAMSRVDVNHDGVITYQEHMDFASRDAAERFARMDRDHDGRISVKELAGAEQHRQSQNPGNGASPNGNHGQPPSAQTIMSRADANHDGSIDSNEYVAMVQQQAANRFKFADKNRDGRLERSEMQPGQKPAGQQ